MEEGETVVAESSPAAVEVTQEPVKPQIDPLQEGPMGTWTREQRNEFRSTGKMPEAKPKAEPAPAKPAEGDKPEITPEPAPENEQEPPEGLGNKARRRFEKLLAENKALKAAQQTKPDVQTAPSPAPQMPPTRPEPTLNDTKEDGTPKYADYADYVKDLGRWSAEQALHEMRQRDIQQQNYEQARQKVESARERYKDEFESILEPTAGALMGNSAIPTAVKQMIADSDVSPDLIYTIGTDQKTMEKLIRLCQTNPNQALFYLADLSAGIRQELAADETPIEKPAPEPNITKAPKPPAEVGGRATAPGDALVAAATANDFRAFKAELNRRSLAGVKSG